MLIYDYLCLSDRHDEYVTDLLLAREQRELHSPQFMQWLHTKTLLIGMEVHELELKLKEAYS